MENPGYPRTASTCPSAPRAAPVGGSVSHLGYPAIFLVLLIEAIGIPSPDEATLFVAGMAAGRGLLNGPVAMLAAALGAFTGSVISYFLARRLGRPIILRYGRRVGLSEERLGQAERFMARYESGAVYLGRIVTGVRLVIGYAAGLFEIPPGVFMLWSALGAASWAIIDVGAGMVLGSEVTRIEHVVAHHVEWSIVGAVIVVGAAFAYGMARRRRRGNRQRPS